MVQRQRVQAMSLSQVDKSRQPAVNKTRAPNGTIPVTPSSVDHANCLCQCSAKNLLRQPAIASVATAITSVATVVAIHITALPSIQEQGTDDGEDHGTNSLGREVAEETINVDPAEEGPELVVRLPSMFDQETVIEGPNFVCMALQLCQSVGNQTSMMSICINCNLSTHHFCAEYPSEQSPVEELKYIAAKDFTDFTKEGKICYRKNPRQKNAWTCFLSFASANGKQLRFMHRLKLWQRRL